MVPAFSCMLMSLMRRWNVVLVLLLALSVAGQPSIHQHPLIPDGHDGGPAARVSLPCAICVTSTARVLVETPSILAPAPIIHELPTSSTPVRSIEHASAVPSRAPPVA